jgi:hypothetical protein
MPDNTFYLSRDDVKRRIIAAVCMLYRHDRELLAVDANERSITHKLAEHLQREFPCWHVDCEYNRRGAEVKRLNVNFRDLRPDDLEAKTVFPDIIIHRRGTDQNLVVLEIKKSAGSDNTRDIEKLKAFTAVSEYQYIYGLFLKLAPNGDGELELYEGGRRAANWTDDLRAALQELGYGG